MAQSRITGLERFNRWLKRLEQKARSPKDLMDRVAQYGESSTVRRIRDGVGPENAPLTRKYKKSGNTLRDTGALMNSITAESSATYAAWGSSLPYARIQQEGGTIEPKKAKKLAIPAGWQARRLMRKYGESPAKCIQGMKAAGYRVWFLENAIMADEGKGQFVLFIRKDSVEIPARQYLKIDDADEREIERIVNHWLGEDV
jgi:phage gpG-like protein